MDTYFHGIWRMDWGLGNPNKTAALIAILMVAVWGLVYIRRWGFWAALTLFTALGVCLIKTFSRGGLIALAVGMVPLLWKTARPWSKRKIAAVVVSIWVMIGVSVLWEAHERLGQGVAQEDKSITHRLELWMKAPRMMADAPGGWGLGNSGRAYMQWYQPLDRGEEYRTLVNSHLTWLVEFGWPFRFFYIAGWLTVLLLCFPSSNVGHRASNGAFCVSLGIWLCFGTAAWFSSVAESPWLWIVPSISGLAVLFARFGNREWPAFRLWILMGAAAMLAVAGLWVAGSCSKSRNIRCVGGRVILGQGVPGIWVVLDQETMGDSHGKALRQALVNRSQTVGVVRKAGDLPPGGKGTLVAGGRWTQEELAVLKTSMSDCGRLILLNPAFTPVDLELSGNMDKDRACKLNVFFGAYSQSPAMPAWNDLLPVQQIDGAGNFMAGWADLIFREICPP
ncbi:MAG: O-antigen ligase family protein [Verrucomicrobiae bacterium]|nr:O-antigen ligase family protein [Verrucomicrobiae bacterium]